ncbi:MAG: SpoIIE family protein phosphatase [Actinomycetota bacterium]
MTDQEGDRTTTGLDPAGAGEGGAPSVLVWTADQAGRCTSLGEEWAAFTGQPTEAALGDGWTEPVHPDDLGARRAAHRRAGAGCEPVEVEFRLRRRDGTWRWMLERAVARAGEAPATVVAGACFDVTERRRNEVELLRSREDLRLALAAGHMGTWVWERATGRVWRDPNLQALYGLPPEPSSGSFDEWVSLVHPDDRERVVGEVERAMAEGGVYELEHRVLRPDGGVRWLERRGEVYFDEAGEVAGTRGLVIDITDRKLAEEERSRLLAAEREARRAAEVAAGRVARLQAVTAGLAHARTADEVAEVVAGQGAAGLEADSSALCLVSADGTSLRVARAVGYDASALERYRTFSVDAPLPASQAIRTGEMVLLASITERDERFPALADVPAQNQSFAVVPVFLDGRPAGAIALGWRAPRRFDDDDRGFLTALAQQAGQALDRARFSEAQQRRAGQQAFLAEASRILGSSLDHEAALAEVVRLAVPAMADSCEVALLEEGALRTLAAVHAGAERAGAAGRLAGRPWCAGEDQLLAVAQGTEPLVVAGAGAECLPAPAGDDADRLALPGAPATVSAMAVPLRSGDQALGVVMVATSGRPYGPDDVAFVEDLAARAAAAVANGRAHQARTAIAHTLQRSLLPPEVPLVPGLERAARYRPIGPDVEVGGDFYDVFAAGGGRWGIAIGDVSGKGVPAASLTALARYTLRATARREASPAAVLDALNSSILDDDGDEERFCTVALAFLHQGTGGVHLTLSCGGQPLPVLLDRSGAIRALGEAGTAVGLFGSPALTDATYVLQPGDQVVFFTDGVVEARSPDGGFADGLLERTLAGCAGLHAEDVAEAVEQAVLDFGGGRQRDDLAILVVRRPDVVFSERIVPGPQAVARARLGLRDWLGPRLAGEAELADDVLLVANELATNAERVARDALDLHVCIEPDRVVVDVADDGPGAGLQVPPNVAPAVDALDGRGLHIVGRLADRCDVRSTSYGTLVRWVARRRRRP